VDDFKNFAYSNVTVAPVPSDSGTTLTVMSGDGVLFPTPPFQATVWPVGEIPVARNAEIVRVTNITGDVFTVIRGQEGTPYRGMSVGNQIVAALTAKTVDDLLTASSSSYAADLGSGTTVVATHNLGTKDVVVAVYRVSDGVEVDVPFSRTSTNAITLNSAVNLAGHRVVVLGAYS